ncbi:MAG: DNA polymerase III subunit beta [Candidatus Sungbacteria bacterium]|nr:DNA polymerase III subunit beta [Candidatus Sungbacteria bacterium]
MIVTVMRMVLRDGLSIAERFCGKQLSLPIVGNILIKTEGQKLKIQATNLELGIEISIPAKITKEGGITIPPRILSSLLQTLTDEKITLQEKQNTLILETNSSKSEIRGIPWKDFPIMPLIKGKVRIVIPNTLFINQLNKVLPAVSVNDFKPEIGGVLFFTDKKVLILAGTDTFRLSEALVKDFNPEEPVSAIIPLRPLQELVKIAKPDEETTITIHEGQAAIETGSARIISRLVGGRYPEYKNLIPKDFSTTIRVPREELLDAARLSGAFASKLNDILLSYRPGHLVVEIVNPEVGKHTREIGAKISGKSGRIGFNYRYLSDALETISSKEVSVYLTDETKPALIKDEGDQTFFTILMPIRIS